MSKGLWVEIKESSSDFDKIIRAALGRVLSKAFSAAYPAIVKELKTLVHHHVSNADVIKDLMSGGMLRGELGLSSGSASSAAKAIAQEIGNSVEAEFTGFDLTRGSSIGAGAINRGGLTIYIQNSAFTNILSLAQSSISYYSKKHKTTVKLDWLNWLLTQGDKIIVAKYQYVPKKGKGRSGLGTMKKNGTWRVDPNFSGTAKDNFITRALDNDTFKKHISDLISKELTKHL